MVTGNEIRKKIIEAYFREFNKRVNYLETLARQSRETEATLLACCYIEALARRVWPEETSSKRIFVNALKKYGDTSLMACIHPEHLREQLTVSRSISENKIAKKLQAVPFGQYVYTETRFFDIADPYIEDQEKNKLKSKCWIGSLASLIYVYIRCQLVHSGSAIDIELGVKAEDGHHLPILDFSVVYSPLKIIVAEVEKHCLHNPLTFGPMKQD